jgi:hypothetical protein
MDRAASLCFDDDRFLALYNTCKFVISADVVHRSGLLRKLLETTKPGNTSLDISERGMLLWIHYTARNRLSVEDKCELVAVRCLYTLLLHMVFAVAIDRSL